MKRRWLLLTVAWLGLQYALTVAMDRAAVVDALLSAGAHTPIGDLAMAATFVLVRLSTLVLLPGLLVAWALWPHRLGARSAPRVADFEVGDQR